LPTYEGSSRTHKTYRDRGDAALATNVLGVTDEGGAVN